VFREVKEPGHNSLKAEATLQVNNDYPLDFVMPSLNFEIFVDSCSPNEPYIKLADAQTPSVHLEPKKDLNMKVAGFIRNLPDAVLKVCPKSQMSPLDSILGDYIQGDDTTVYVRGSHTPSKETPKWMADLMSQLTIALPFPGHAFGHLVKDFQLQNVHFELPDPSGDSSSIKITPKVSADVRALVIVPEEMNFPIEVHRFKAAADVFYHEKKLGYLDLDEWRSAKSNPVKNTTTGHEDLEVISRMNKVPLTITDNDVFVEVVQGLIHDKDTLRLSVKADVDVAMKTSLGEFVVRGIPTEGKVPIKRKIESILLASSHEAKRICSSRCRCKLQHFQPTSRRSEDRSHYSTVDNIGGLNELHEPNTILRYSALCGRYHFSQRDSSRTCHR